MSFEASVRVRYNKAMRLVRRAHLYAGLFMTPWVFLYGVTAFLFNHPDVFPDQARYRFQAADLAGTPLENSPPPEAAAADVVAALNGSRSDGGYRFGEPQRGEHLAGN